VVVDAEVRADSVSNAHDFVEYCVKTTQDDWIDVKSLSQRTKLLPDTVEKIISELVKQGKVKKYAKKYIHIETLGELEEKVIKFIKQFHADNPQSPGIERVKLFELCSLEKGLFDELISHMLADGELSERKNRIALSGHSESFSDEQLRLLEKIETYYQKQLFNPPNSKEIQNLTGIEAGKINLLLQILLEQQRLIKIDKDLFFHCQAVDKARQILIDYIKQHDRLESVEFKYLLDTTRKFAIPLLDYFDSTGLLRRQGNTRYLKITDTK
jgi:selenocysteine-specific elongation factor